MSLIQDPTSAIQEKARKLWEGYGRDFLQTHPQPSWDQSRWQQAATNDLTYQYNRVSKLHILGRGQGATLEKLFTQVYLLPEQDALKRYGEDVNRPGMWVGRMTVRAGERQDGLALAAAHNRLYILGQPGAGKTTFLKRMALEAIPGEIAQWPMFVPLVEVAQAKQTIAGFMAAQLAEAGFNDTAELTRYLLAAGGLLLLLDGLDEVPEEQNQQQIIREIEQLSNRFSQIKLLLTCRTAAASYKFIGFHYAEMAEFNEPQIKTFVHNWFGSDREETATACLRALTQTETFKEMSRVPLLLTLLCLSYDSEKGFSPGRARIYRQAIDGLLQEWDNMRGVAREATADLRPGQTQELLAYVAYQAFLDGHQLMAQTELSRRVESYCQRHFKQSVDGQQWLKQAEANTGLLIERSQEVFAFAHLTVHEYLTAWWIIEKESWDKFQQHIADPRWGEVMLLMAELPVDATLYLILFLEALQAMVASDNDLVALLQWGAVKSATNGGRPATGRAFYIFLSLSRARNRVFARDLSLDLARDLDLSLNLDLVLSCARVLDRPRVLDLSLSLSLALALSSQPLLALDYLLSMLLLVAQILATAGTGGMDDIVAAELRETATQLDQFCRDAYLPDLQANLAILHLPSVYARDKELKAFATQLREIALTHRDLGREWNFSKRQASLLAKYLQTNRLFVECLNLAYVPDRAAIENQILLPPGMW